MSCRYCKPIGDASSTCHHCRRLIEVGAWLLLADIWLHNRPQDWTSDVAAFLELTEGLGSKPTRLRDLVA